MQNSIDDKLFDAVIKIAAENALEQEMDEMPSCEELNARHKPSPDLDRKIKKIIARRKLKERATVWRKTATKIIAGIAVFIIISATVLLSVEATRNYIFNALIKWQEGYVSIEYNHNETKLPEAGVYKPTYLPEGFTEISSKTTGEITRTVYQNETEATIMLSQYPAQSSNTLFDNEGREFKNIQINGQEAYLFESIDLDKDNVLIWEANGIMFSINSGLESGELILIAESIKK